MSNKTNATLVKMVKGLFGYQVQALAVSSMNFWSSNEVAKSKLIRPIKERTIEESIDEFADYKSGLNDEFLQIAEQSEEVEERLFHDALPVANASVLLARDIARTEPTTAFWLKDVVTPEQRIESRIKYLFNNPDSENETRKAVIETLGNIEGVSENLEVAKNKSKSEQNEMIKNSLMEFQSLNNASEIMKLSTDELIDIVSEYEPNTEHDILEGINNRIVGIVQSYTKGKSKSIDSELVMYAKTL